MLGFSGVPCCLSNGAARNSITAILDVSSPVRFSSCNLINLRIPLGPYVYALALDAARISRDGALSAFIGRRRESAKLKHGSLVRGIDRPTVGKAGYATLTTL